jgi:hypothetical protein
MKKFFSLGREVDWRLAAAYVDALGAATSMFTGGTISTQLPPHPSRNGRTGTRPDPHSI